LCERAKVRNGSRFASFRFEAKHFLKRNRRTLNSAAETLLADVCKGSMNYQT
jgi:hypothetical protein